MDFVELIALLTITISLKWAMRIICLTGSPHPYPRPLAQILQTHENNMLYKCNMLYAYKFYAYMFYAYMFYVYMPLISFSRVDSSCAGIHRVAVAPLLIPLDSIVISPPESTYTDIYKRKLVRKPKCIVIVHFFAIRISWTTNGMAAKDFDKIDVFWI